MITKDPEGGPAYRVLARKLREQIGDGTIHGFMPSEQDLIQIHGVGRDTVRKAIGVLRTEGLVIVRHGYVTRVRDDFTVEQVKVPRGSIIRYRPATAEEQYRLGLGDNVWMAEVAYGSNPVVVYALDRTEMVFN